MAGAGLDPVSPPVTGHVQAPPGGRRWAVCRLAVGASDADEANATAFCRVEGLGVLGHGHGGRRRCLSGLGDRCGDVGAGGLDRDRGLDAAAGIAGFPALSAGGAQPPAPHAPAGVGWPQRAWTMPVAVTTAHGVAAHASASRLPCSRLAGGAGAVGAGDAGSCQRCWSIPGPSSPEHTFREDNRSSSVRLKRSAGHGGRVR